MGSDCRRARSLFVLVKAEPSILYEDLVVLMLAKKKRKQTLSNRTDFSRFGIPLPSKRTVRRKKPGYTMASGIIKNLLVSILRIADSQNTCCYVNSSTVKAIAISLTRDGLGFKPGLEFDERKKVLVGSPNKIDMDYIRKNPVPNPSQPKQGMTFQLLQLLIERSILPLESKPQISLEKKCWLKLKKLLDIYKPVLPVSKPSQSPVILS